MSRSRIAYNTLFELKRRLGGLGLPPYEPLTPEAKAVLNPAFTPGMGVINADADRGLQCPVCGIWVKLHLGKHISWKHGNMGGVSEVKRLLGYSQHAALVTVESHARSHKSHLGQRVGLANPGRGHKPGTKLPSRSGQGALNMRGSCRAQMVALFKNLEATLGHQPSIAEWRAAGYPLSFRNREGAAWKTWQEFVLAAGGRVRRRGPCTDSSHLQKRPNGECLECARRYGREYQARKRAKKRVQATEG